MGDTDDIFLKNFSLVIVALVGITFMILFIAGLSEPAPDPTANPSRVALAYDRTTPVGRVRTDPAQLETTTAAAAPAATSASASAGPTASEGAVDGASNAANNETDEMVTIATAAPVDTSGIDGGAIYAQACQACHLAGAAGAPIPGSDLWAERAQKGLEQLAYNAINGINAMPARGGRPDLSDAEVTAAVEHMLAQ